MPKVEIDYSNTIFYKIFCKDPTIKDLYVGLTTNFIQRKHGHKQSCKNEKAMNHNCKLYNTIRNAGGWENWQMEIIAFHNCKDSYEAHKKEQEYFEMLGATLNSIEPLPKPKEPITKIVKEKTILFCESCNIHFSYWKAQEAHNNTNKHHKMVEMYNDNKVFCIDNNLTTESSHNLAKKYFCESCDYFTSKKCNYDKHLMSRKHDNNNNNNQKVVKSSYPCNICNKSFNDRAGLWRHTKKCGVIATTPTEKDKSEHIGYNMQTNLILELVKQNQELKQLLIEQTNTIIEVAKNSQVNNNTHI